MLRTLLIASFTMSSLAASCSIDANGTACESPTASSCVEVCSYYDTKNGCESVPGCKYTTTNFMGVVSGTCSANNTSCRSYYNSTECTNNAVCRWETKPCKYKLSCKSANSSSSGCASSPNMAESECTKQSGCAMKGECEESNRCGILTDQNSCTASSGCFWVVGSTSGFGVSSTAGSCGLCFNDPTNLENVYLTTLSHVGQTCTVSFLGLTASVHYSLAVAAASGCSGGSPLPDPAGMTCGAAGLSASLAMLLAALFLA